MAKCRYQTTYRAKRQRRRPSYPEHAAENQHTLPQRCSHPTVHSRNRRNWRTHPHFFNGAFSHAVIRQPAAGEWRANSRYGVRILPWQPPCSVTEQTAKILGLLPQTPLYARIDGTLTAHNHFLLNELELIEPALYLEYAPPECTERFAQAIASTFNH